MTTFNNFNSGRKNYGHNKFHHPDTFPNPRKKPSNDDIVDVLIDAAMQILKIIAGSRTKGGKI